MENEFSPKCAAPRWCGGPAAARENAAELPVGPYAKLVVFSDLHMGDGSDRDDFVRNGALFESVLAEEYLKKGYTLILNGDIEELQKFHVRDIEKRWAGVYGSFDAFRDDGRLVRIEGNHDTLAAQSRRGKLRYPMIEALRLFAAEGELFVLHGHQFAEFLYKFNAGIEWILRRVCKPLGFRNIAVAIGNERKFKVERRAYRFASRNGILAIMGHTHRPLFETLSKSDALKYRIEHLCRHLPAHTLEERARAEEEIRKSLAELRSRMRSRKEPLGGIYSRDVTVPCLFNSGCAIGKRGLTCIEIEAGSISLVRWSDPERTRVAVKRGPVRIDKLPNPYACRTVLRTDRLSYIFAKTRLLGDAPTSRQPSVSELSLAGNPKTELGAAEAV